VEVLHPTMSDGATMIAPMHCNNATDQLTSVEVIQDIAWLLSSQLVNLWQLLGKSDAIWDRDTKYWKMGRLRDKDVI
jgi:hypothetical protein